MGGLFGEYNQLPEPKLFSFGGVNLRPARLLCRANTGNTGSAEFSALPARLGHRGGCFDAMKVIELFLQFLNLLNNQSRASKLRRAEMR